MTDRESILAYIATKAQKHRRAADNGNPGWALARHDATLLEVLHDEILNQFDVETSNGK